MPAEFNVEVLDIVPLEPAAVCTLSSNRESPGPVPPLLYRSLKPGGVCGAPAVDMFTVPCSARSVSFADLVVIPPEHDDKTKVFPVEMSGEPEFAHEEESMEATPEYCAIPPWA